jgi:sugar lactone lactonase YvrE
MSEIFDPTRCALGEGPLWHPLREQFFWFDIQKGQLLTREGGKTRIRQFDEHVSAAGWVSETELLIASETRLFLWDVERERAEDVEPLEAENTLTRSNDGRADPWGGFWIGTMAKKEPGEGGAIWRYHGGRLTKLYDGIRIPNAMCFSPDRRFAYYADTPTLRIMRQSLDPASGYPEGEPEIFVDLAADNLKPDGAVVDTAGNLWNAQWDAGQVAVYSPAGEFLKAIAFPAPRTTCPAFGGTGLTTLYCTSDSRDMPTDDGVAHGAVFAVPEAGQGQAEHRVIL